MKKLQHIIMIALILLGLVTPALAQEQTDSFNVSAKHAIAIEATTGKVLYEKDATTPDGVASMTKILTAYMVYKAVDQGKITWFFMMKTVYHMRLCIENTVQLRNAVFFRCTNA